MIAFDYKEVHRDKLFNELVSAGIELQPTSAMYCYLLNEDGKIWIDTSEENRSKVQSILDAHNSNTDDTRQALLNKLGITEEEAQVLLGGN